MAELFDKVVNADSLYDSFLSCKKNSIWKESVQRFESNILLNILDLRRKLKDFTYKQKPFKNFILSERGHTRFIKSLHISDRVVQKSLCRILIPIVRKHLIYDNGASLKGKGISFTRKRLKEHLQKFYRKNKNNGYILLADFSKFFDNIPHEKLFEFYSKYVGYDKEFMNLISLFINSFKENISYKTDEEIEDMKNRPFNMLEHNNKLQELKKNGYKLIEQIFTDRGVGIGSELSQISGVGYVTFLDSYIKTVKSVKLYGRYMDDFYIIHNDKRFLKQLLDELKVIVRNNGLFLSENKCKIIPLRKEFVFLKNRYSYTRTGKVICRLNHETIIRHGRKIKKLLKFYSENKITLQEIINIHKGCIGTYKRCNSYKMINNLKSRCNNLYKEIKNVYRIR